MDITVKKAVCCFAAGHTLFVSFLFAFTAEFFDFVFGASITPAGSFLGSNFLLVDVVNNVVPAYVVRKFLAGNSCG